ncbi:hypothetical protein FA13DRAFT_1738215 [Coprinellus micaceus]|uniref:Uncharacterized protein n=1 Tax=Coprinellus micaceus TaxID=71717 RepID=A0A4Y7SW79_COPMI|nr:hypothetical protein FA13DRAFT_1738215 [Coprinellus micaceus]
MVRLTTKCSPLNALRSQPDNPFLIYGYSPLLPQLPFPTPSLPIGPRPSPCVPCHPHIPRETTLVAALRPDPCPLLSPSPSAGALQRFMISCQPKEAQGLGYLSDRL